jgi:hypothetical protein
MNYRLIGLTARALWTLVRYEVTLKICGFPGVARQLAARRQPSRESQPGAIALVREAVTLACCFYYKPVVCLQKSVVTTLLLRQYHVDCVLVIGYRLSPFLSHAWVETKDQRAINDSPAYRQQLRVLWTA